MTPEWTDEDARAYLEDDGYSAMKEDALMPEQLEPDHD